MSDIDRRRYRQPIFGQLEENNDLYLRAREGNYYHESAVRELVKLLERIGNEAKMWGGAVTDLGSLASESFELLTHYKDLIDE